MTRYAEFGYNFQAFILIILIIIFELGISAEMVLFAPYGEEIFVYPYVVMDFWLYNALKDANEFLNSEPSYFIVLSGACFYIYLLSQLLFENLRHSGSVYSAGLGLSLGGLISNGLMLTVDGAKVPVYLSTTCWDISSHATFNISSLCMILGIVMCAVGSWFRVDCESPGNEECYEERLARNEEQLGLL